MTGAALRMLWLFLGVLAGGSAAAAEISIVSMQYSTTHMVPHLHYEGDVVPEDLDNLRAVYERHVRCREECATPDGRSNAVLTMNSPGGNYIAGLELAQFLRENHIATVVENGSACYSACAFAFLGGSGYSPQNGIGSYIDRVVVPGAILGFHAPYFPEDSLVVALQQLGASVVMGDNRRNFALMVEQLVRWNVDPSVIAWMMNMGPDESYDIVTPNDYFLTRVALPPAPATTWVGEKADAVRNVCVRLIANQQRVEPLSAMWQFEGQAMVRTGVNQFGDELFGFRISDTPLRIGHCSITATSLATDGDFDIALYMTAGIDGTSAPVFSFFNRGASWSSAGSTENPAMSIFQKGSLNHYFLPPDLRLDEAPDKSAFVRFYQNFFMLTPPPLPGVGANLAIVSQTSTSRIARAGDIWLFLETGGKQLFDSARDSLGKAGVTVTNESVSDISFVRSGTYSDGSAFAWVGLSAGSGAALLRIENLRSGDIPLTPEEASQFLALQCAAELEGVRLNCGG